MAPDSYVHAVLNRAIRIELCLFQHLKHLSVKWDAIQHSALSHTLWCDFLRHHSTCAATPTEGNDYIVWMPVVNGVLFPQAVLQACQTLLLRFQTHRLDKKW